MFNKSLGTASFPDSWKTARVTPIFKDGEKDDKSNYHPISILPLIAKVFERIVFNQLYEYLQRNFLLYRRQSGFREFFSTIPCLLVNVDDWCWGSKTGHYIASVFIDLRKAVGTVDHRILCGKLVH